MKQTTRSAELINGRAISEEILAEAAAEAARLERERGVTPGLAAVLVGDDPASQVYVKNKTSACERAGVFTETFALHKSTTEDEVIRLVQELNGEEVFHGILVQLPLPPGVRPNVVIQTMSPAKDVDGLHPFSLGQMVLGMPGFLPATPLGIQEMLLRSGYEIEGKHVVVCGRSDLVGKPLSLLLARKARGANATVTLCHTGTRNLADLTRSADILVAAVGSPEVITGDMVKQGAVVIDVGINRVQDATVKRGYRLVGDVHFDSVSPRAAAITPVPGGVGPVTVATLIANTVKAARLASERPARTPAPSTPPPPTA
jgi:methylenetetrahydrofolate dehydrogenase (NADP+)/methenyltetrahydrofolate cyclohydrolase